MLKQLFGITISHQTVLNYAEAAAYHCHRFNLARAFAPGAVHQFTSLIISATSSTKTSSAR